jgi:GTPase
MEAKLNVSITFLRERKAEFSNTRTKSESIDTQNNSDNNNNNAKETETINAINTSNNNCNVVIKEFLVRKNFDSDDFMEVRVAVVGNVDSGKSTLLGVLTHGVLDDGRGDARNLFRSKFCINFKTN